jgi:hypothetical protein
MAFLNQNIKNIESRKNVDERSKSSQCKKEEIFSLTQQDLKNNISNMNNKTNNNNIKDYLLSRNIPKFDTKKLILRNVPSSSIGPYDDIIKNKNRKQNVISNYNKKNNHVICQSISNYININQSEFNDLSRENSFNNKRNNKNNSFIIDNNNLKLKLPLNITNNNYNMNKNNVMINLNTNILSNNLQLEQLKIQQRLEDYRKLIDQRIDQLLNSNKKNIAHKKKRNNNSSSKKYDIYIKDNVASINSDYQRKTKKKFYKISQTTYKYNNNNDCFQKIHDRNVLIPKIINGSKNKILIDSNSQKNITNNNNCKTIIVSKNIDIKKKYKLEKNDEDIKNNRNLHDQITSKGSDEDKKEDDI